MVQKINLNELRNLVKEEIINQFIKDASIEKLEQVMYTFKNDKVIVNKIEELLALIKSYN